MSHSLLAGRTTISDFSEQRQKVLDRFQASPYGALRLIHCTCDGSGIVLRGRVPSYYLKQLAQALASEATDVQRIDNQLEVT